MSRIRSMTTFSQEDLYCVLKRCEENLEDAYQESLNKELWAASCQAKLACTYLMYEIQKEKNNHQIH